MVIFVAVWKINYAPSSADAEAPSEWIKLEGAVMKTVYEMFPFALPRGFRLLRYNQQQKVYVVLCGCALSDSDIQYIEFLVNKASIDERHHKNFQGVEAGY